MSIVVRFHPTNVEGEVRRKSATHGSGRTWPNPAGLELHVAFGAEDNLRVSEIWTSREQFQAYGEKLMPILSDMGSSSPASPRCSRFRTSSSSA